MNKQSKGAALVMVLLISAILGSMSVLLVLKTKQHTQRISIAKDFMQAERDLLTDLSHLIYETQTTPYAIMGDSNLFPFSRAKLPKGINLQGHPFSYRNSTFSIQDMGALISLTPFDRDLLYRYLSHLNWPQNQIYSFLDVLQDWSDDDSLQRVNGAETLKYKVNGYPLNKFVQDTRELGLFANIDPLLLKQLSTDTNLIAYSAGTQTRDYAPDELLSIYNTDFDAASILQSRNEHRKTGKNRPSNQYSSGNWIIKVNTGYQQAKSSKMLRLMRRFGEHRPFVISQWHERAN